MGAYPAYWEADVVLRDGATAHLRPIVPEDADRLVRFHSRLSERTRYLRYFGPFPQIPPRELARMTTVDHYSRVAFVGMLGGEIIAIGIYESLAGDGKPGTAEVAFVVADEHQGRGLGPILLEHLAGAAAENGFTRFEAEVLPQNRKMLGVFSDAGYEVSRRFEDGVVMVHFDIEPTEQSQSVRLAREHRAEAASIQSLLHPASVAVVGASRAPGTIGYSLLAHIVDSGFTGTVHAVNPSGGTIAGIEAVARLSDIDEPVDLAVVAVLSGNRNFEGRINPDVKMNYLASPPLVVAYALAGTMDFDFDTQPLGQDQAGNDVFLKDIWPSAQDVEATIAQAITKDLFVEDYADVFAGDDRWRSLPTPEGQTFAWDAESTYVRKPPYFEGMGMEAAPVEDISGARVLALLGDSVTTDHISPAGAIKADSPAGRYLAEHGIDRKDFNSYGSRRGNHEVMIRGTFANIRLKNLLLDGVEGGFTRNFLAGGEQTTIYDASVAYQEAGVPLVVLAGAEYGSGSSRDWAAKGTSLLGVRAVIAQSYERIHRSNLIGMGVVPLQFPEGQSAQSLGLDGTETFDISGLTALNEGTTPRTVSVTATKEGGEQVTFDAVVRIDTPGEADYYRNGGILQYVLRSLVK